MQNLSRALKHKVKAELPDFAILGKKSPSQTFQPMSSLLSKWYDIWKLVPDKFDGFEDHDHGILRVILPFDFE